MARTSQTPDLDARMAERRIRGGAVRDLSPNLRREASTLEQPFRTPIGWLAVVAINIGLAVLVGLAFVAGPPLLDCREQSVRGFFVGDSFPACAQRGVAARFADIDGRIRRIVLHSGQ